MKSKHNYSIITICACLLLSTLVRAQNVASRFHLDESDGMVAELVSCLAEDTTGIIWIGTTEGLLGYDGVGFECYSTDNSGLPGNVFTDIWAEPNGSRLWLGLKSGLAVMDIPTRRIRTLNDEGFFNIADHSAPAKRCVAMTKEGKRCKNQVVANSKYCRVHKAKPVAAQKCKAKTQNGKRCSRAAKKGGYCAQHYKLMRAK